MKVNDRLDVAYVRHAERIVLLYKQHRLLHRPELRCSPTLSRPERIHRNLICVSQDSRKRVAEGSLKRSISVSTHCMPRPGIGHAVCPDPQTGVTETARRLTEGAGPATASYSV